MLMVIQICARLTLLFLHNHEDLETRVKASSLACGRAASYVSASDCHFRRSASKFSARSSAFLAFLAPGLHNS